LFFLTFSFFFLFRPALKLTKSATGMRPETSEDAARASPPQPSPVPSGTGKSPASSRGGNTSAGRAAPEPSDHRAEEDLSSPPEAEDTGVSNIGAGTEDDGRAEPLVPPVPKKKKKKSTASSPSKTMPEPSAQANSPPAKEAPEASAPSKDTPTPPPAAPTGKPAAAKPTPPEGAKLTAQELAAVVTAATAPSSGSRSLVLHAGHAAVTASQTALAQLGRITELTRGEVDLGPMQARGKVQPGGLVPSHSRLEQGEAAGC
jgi:hypothetical protein